MKCRAVCIRYEDGAKIGETGIKNSNFGGTRPTYAKPMRLILKYEIDNKQYEIDIRDQIHEKFGIKRKSNKVWEYLAATMPKYLEINRQKLSEESLEKWRIEYRDFVARNENLLES